MSTTYLLLHGGAGSHSMSALADALRAHGQVIAPTHPGFDGTERLAHLTNVRELAKYYVEMLAREDVEDVVVVGNSMGGWVAVEMAMHDPSRIARLIVLDAVGIEGKIVDPMKLDPPERLPLSFHNPRLGLALIKPGTPPTAMLANAAALKAYVGEMFDLTLAGRLAQLRTPTIVAWGVSDRIVDVDYGKRFAAAIPGARFVEIAEAGHFPQIEQREATVAVITSL